MVSSNDEYISAWELENDLHDNNDMYNFNETCAKPSYEFSVRELATPQINTGNFVKSSASDLYSGEHSFEININNSAFEIQYKVNENDTNKSVLEKLSRLINNSSIGLSTKILNKDNKIALEITSDATGLSFNQRIFTLNNSKNKPNDSTINTFGLNNMTTEPTNAKFLLNGIEKNSSSNTFTLNNTCGITLNAVSKENETTTVSYRENIDKIINSVKSLTGAYNNLINLSKSNVGIGKYSSNAYNDFKNINNSYKNQLESIGININEDNNLDFDEAILIQSYKDDTLNNSLLSLKDFSNSVSVKSEDICINPMKFINKILISYPNPKKSYANPYITSIYSGMMYNSYL